MFILKSQDVQISSIQSSKGQQIPILSYQGQTFRLLRVFNASQEEDAKDFWRDLTDNKGKACVLLEEPSRYSVWGKVRLGGGAEEVDDEAAAAAHYTQACLLLLQAVYFDVEDLLGSRQAGAFKKDIVKVFEEWKFPQAASSEAVDQLLEMDPLADTQVPSWQEHHINTLLQELHRLAKSYFGNTSFINRALDILQDMPDADRKQFTGWLSQSPLGKLWAT